MTKMWIVNWKFWCWIIGGGGPTSHDLLKRQVVERGKALRAEYLRGFWRRIVSWYQARAAVAQLQSLDDAALKDIGLHRSGIETAVVNGLAEAEPRKRQASVEPQKRRIFPEKPHLWLQRTG
jgi:uncharacterized protein YjiS (DUF1127 family)